MRIVQSWRKLALGFSAVGLCALGAFSQPAGISTRAAAPPTPRAHVPARQQTQAAAPQVEKKETTAGEAYMNLEVLKDVPQDQLIPAMRYITVALGVECNFCHNTKDFSNDDKPQKTTARNMMKMMFAINKDNFNGRREVTCYTCHHGVSHAANIPLVLAVTAPNGSGGSMPSANHGPAAGAPHSGAANAAPAASGPMPPVAEILAKYATALGGDAAVQKITSLNEKGTIELPARGMKAPVDVLRAAPDKAVATVHLPMGDMTEGYDGSTAWQSRPGRAAESLAGDELLRAKLWAAFVPGLNIKQDFSRSQVLGMEKIGDRDAYRVVAFHPGGAVRFYFDKDSGLLLRVSERIESPLGALPQDTDYSDYRDVNGVKVPFAITVAHADGPTVYKWDTIQANVPVDESRFAKPLAKAPESE